MKNTILIISVISCCAGGVFYHLLHAWRFKKALYDEYKRGLFVGIDYHHKHGEYPDHYRWNRKFYEPDFDIDDTTGDAAEYQKWLKYSEQSGREIDSAFWGADTVAENDSVTIYLHKGDTLMIKRR